MELVKQLHDKRQNLVAALRERHAEVEAGNAEAQAAADQLNAEISDLGSRIDNLMTSIEVEKHAAEQRSRFEKLITPNQENGIVESFAERMRTWLKAAMPDAEVWAPRTITIKLGSVGTDVRDRGWILPGLPQMERHDLTKGTATDGAELIPVGFVRTLYEHLIEFAAIRQTNAQVFRTDSGENMLIPKTTGYGTATLVAEAGPFVENDPQFAQVTLGAYKFGQLVQVSSELTEDSAINLLEFLGRAAGIALGQAIGTYHITGTGTNQPEGIANSPTAGVTGAVGTTLTVTAASLINLYHSVVSGYRRRGYWVMNDATAAAIRLLRDDSGAGAGTGNYLWQPGLSAGTPDTLLGRPVVLDPAMPVMAANAYSIAFGDFSSYFAIRDVNAIQFARSDDFAFANDLITFRSRLRTDSRQLVNGSAGAVKFYRNSAT